MNKDYDLMDKENKMMGEDYKMKDKDYKMCARGMFNPFFTPRSAAG
jgi:hypothetical protein